MSDPSPEPRWIDEHGLVHLVYQVNHRLDDTTYCWRTVRWVRTGTVTTPATCVFCIVFAMRAAGL